MSYEEMITEEAKLWGEDAQDKAASMPPDYEVYRKVWWSVRGRSGAEIERCLASVRPGMKVAELGCSAGWLSIALARRGADVTGFDISEPAIEIAKNYYEANKDAISGKAAYFVADLNQLELEAASYDLVVARGTLHHLIKLDHLVDQVYRALKPGGLFWVDDTNGDEAFSTTLIAGGLTFILPTQLSYAEKFRAVRQFGLNTPSRVKASMEADGLSPFEGSGREYDWLTMIQDRFEVERQVNMPAFTGYVAEQLTLPNGIGFPLLRVMRAIDLQLIRWKLLHNTGVVVYARKPPLE